MIPQMKRKTTNNYYIVVVALAVVTLVTIPVLDVRISLTQASYWGHIKQFMSLPKLNQDNRSVERHWCSDSSSLPINTSIIDQKLVLLFKNNHRYKSCCYREIRREEASNRKEYHRSDWLTNTSNICTPITSVGLSTNVPFVRFECKPVTTKNNKGFNATTTTLHIDFAATVLPPQKHSSNTLSKATYWDQIRSLNQSFEFPPNVLMIGINGLSRLHMRKSLSKSWNYAMQNDFIDFKRFTPSNGSNIFGNAMAMLTGLPENSNSNSCLNRRFFHLDKCPFIWNEFNSFQYMTALVEDSTILSMFNNDKIGFKKQPVDYTPRTLLVAVETYLNQIRNGKWPQIPVKTCINGKSNVDTMLTYIREFVTTVGCTYPYFLVSLFRARQQAGDTDAFNSVRRDDDNLLELLRHVLKSSSRSANNTVIILYSTHGQGYVDDMELNSAKRSHEKVLPALLIRLPSSLKTKFPHWYRNLKQNAERLTSTYDLYNTLQQISSLSLEKVLQQSSSSFQNQNNHSKSLSGLPKAYSLFQDVPKNRSCESVLIPEPYCSFNFDPPLATVNLSTREDTPNNLDITDINYKLVMSKNVPSYHNWAVEKMEKLIKQGMIGFNFSKNHTLNDFVLAKGGQPLRTIIFTTWRAGSTFLGEILESHPGSYYHYEPLNAWDHAPIEPQSAKAMSTIRYHFDCNFTMLRGYMAAQRFPSWLERYNAKLRDFCKMYPPVCWGPKFHQAMCRLFPFQVIKAVRMHLKLARPLLEDSNLNVRVIHLVRDPRGIRYSRRGLPWCSFPDCKNHTYLCSHVEEDYYEARKFRKEFPDRFMVVRYEDLAASIYPAVKKILEFARMNFHPVVKSFLDSHTKANNGGPYSTHRSTNSTPHRWIHSVKKDLKTFQQIQNSCKKALDLWGYKILRKIDEINDFNPVLKPPWPDIDFCSNSSII